MAMLLCRQKAGEPFWFDKLNIGIWSEQELCYVIYNYPVLCLNDFFNERLYVWLEERLKLDALASKLRYNHRIGESSENQMLLVLQSCNYYSVDEVMEFGSRAAEFRKIPGYELTHLEGRLLFSAEKYTAASSRFVEAAVMLDDCIEQCRDEELKEGLLKRKADMFCDMAAARLRLFDEKKALELLVASELTYRNDRAARMRYLLIGAGELSDDMRKELDAEKAEALQKSHETKEYKDILELFEKDSVKIYKEARTIIARWKNNYRKM